jgi:hypothetical protein
MKSLCGLASPVECIYGLGNLPWDWFRLLLCHGRGVARMMKWILKNSNFALELFILKLFSMIPVSHVDLRSWLEFDSTFSQTHELSATGLKFRRHGLQACRITVGELA